MSDRITEDFFARDCLEAAPALVGKVLCRQTADGGILRLTITETEAYRGESDTACHAHKGRTKRTQPLYAAPGTLYVYLCYGMHWMLNFVTGARDQPQAVLVRACRSAEGPGRLTKALSITGDFNGRMLSDCADLWIEDTGTFCKLTAMPRVGIGYAAPEDRERLWRFVMKQ